MSENNQIQEISKLIASLFSQGFKPEFEKFLADKNIPFANQTDLYIQRLFNSVLNIPNVEIISYDFNGSDITVKLSGPFKSYVNVNGKDANFDDNGIATVTIKNAKVSPQNSIFLNLLVQSTPFKAEKDSSLAFDSFSKDENIGSKIFDLSYEQEDKLYKFLVSKKIYNDNPIKYYIISNYGISNGQVTSEDLKDIVAYQCPPSLETYLYDSTGKKKVIYNSFVNDSFIIFDLGE